MPEAVREAAKKSVALSDSKTDLLLLAQVAKKDEKAAIRAAERLQIAGGRDWSQTS